MTNDARGEREPAQLVIYNDDDTPDEFVIGMLRQVFSKTEREAAALMTQIEREDKVDLRSLSAIGCGGAVQVGQTICLARQHPLKITLEEIKTPCELCGKPKGQTDVRIGSRTVWLCSDCIRAADTMSTPREPERSSSTPATFWTGTLPASRAASS